MSFNNNFNIYPKFECDNQYEKKGVFVIRCKQIIGHSIN